MKHLLQRIVLWSVLFLSSFTLYAQSDTDVCQWTRKTLLDTLTIDYHYEKGDNEELRPYYTYNAWNALSGFLGGYVDVVQQQHLTLHPIFIKEPYVVASGIVSGIRYWRVNEIVSIPELKITLAFSLVILKTTPSAAGGFVIQSLNMVKDDNE